MSDTTYFAQTTFIATGGQTVFLIGFPALNSGHLKLALNGVDQSSADWGITGDLTGGSGTLTWTGTGLSAGDIVRIYRRSPETFATLTFQSASIDPATAADFDELVKALLYLVQEEKDRRRPQWVDISAAHTVDPNSAQGFKIDSSGASFTIDLPPAASWRGEILYFDHEVTGNTATLDPDGAELIDGAATDTVVGKMLISSDGVGWTILSEA